MMALSSSDVKSKCREKLLKGVRAGGRRAEREVSACAGSELVPFHSVEAERAGFHIRVPVTTKETMPAYAGIGVFWRRAGDLNPRGDLSPLLA